MKKKMVLFGKFGANIAVSSPMLHRAATIPVKNNSSPKNGLGLKDLAKPIMA